MLPWSVIPIAGICSRCASASMGETFAAPSNIEYSVWLCRCTNDLLIGTPVYDWTPTRTGHVAECVVRLRPLTYAARRCRDRYRPAVRPDRPRLVTALVAARAQLPDVRPAHAARAAAAWRATSST